MKGIETLLLVSLLLVVTVLCDDTADNSTINYDDMLYNDVVANYNPLTMPQTGKSPTQVSIQIQLEIYGVREVDMMGGSVSFKAAFRQWWYDSRLQWNASNYGGIKQIWMSPGDIWVSDMSVRQDKGDNLFTDMKETQVRVSNNGMCYYSMFGDMRVLAQFDLAKYPYDVQNISMVVGSWLYTDDRLHLELYNPPLMIQAPTSWKIDNIQWDFVGGTVETIKSTVASGFYMRYNFQVAVQRQGGTIVIAVVIPGALVTLLGVLFIFLPRDGTRTMYVSTILLTEIMFLVMMTGFVPLSKQVPLIGWLFLGYTVLLTALCVFVLLLDKIQRVFVEEADDQVLELLKTKKEMQKKQEIETQRFTMKLADQLANRFTQMLKFDKFDINKDYGDDEQDISKLTGFKGLGAALRLLKKQKALQEGKNVDIKPIFHKEQGGMDGNNEKVDNFKGYEEIEKAKQHSYDQLREEYQRVRRKMFRINRIINRIDFGGFMIALLAFILLTAVILGMF